MAYTAEYAEAFAEAPAEAFARAEQRPLSEAERLAWLRLFRSDNVGVKAFYHLVNLCGDAEKALEQAPQLSLRGGRKKPITLCSPQKAEEELTRLDAIGARCIALPEPDYPPLLRMINDPPPLITLRGQAEYLAAPAIALVGARNCSANGGRFAHRLARELGEAGMTVVSGLARGIDTAAHKGALPTGTIAVLAGGVDTIYPPENKALYESIAAQGAIIAELPLGAVPRAQHFPRRNRIISGLARGTVVVEATTRSGSLITARLALEQGREVYAVPGSPLDPRAEGPNRLLKQGATLVESARDILDALPPSFTQPTGQIDLLEEESESFSADMPVLADATALDTARDAVRAALSTTPTAIDDLITASNMSAPLVQIILLELELAGSLARQPGNRVSLLVNR